MSVSRLLCFNTSCFTFFIEDYCCPLKHRRCKRFGEPISMRKTMQEPRRGSQLGHRVNAASASKRNFMIDRHVMGVEVRLRRTFHLTWPPPSCAHLQWACMVFPIKVESSTRPASSRHKSGPWFKTCVYLYYFQNVAAIYVLPWHQWLRTVMLIEIGRLERCYH